MRRQIYLITLIFFLSLSGSAPLRSEPQNNPIPIRWQNGYLNFIYDNNYAPESVATFRENLTEALQHPNMNDRVIQEIQVYNDKEWGPSNKTPDVVEGTIFIQFSPGKGYQQLVDELIENSKPKDNGHPLEFEVKITPPDNTYSGSGFFIGQEGHLITCAHVVRDNATVLVQPLLKKGKTLIPEKYEAVIIGKDDFTDLALIKLKDKEVARFHKSYVTFPSILIDYRPWVFQNLRQGQAIEARGFPGGNPGIESGIIESPTANLWGIRTIKVTAKVRPGFSGGTIMHDGYVIGINTSASININPPNEVIGGYTIDFYSAQYTLQQLRLYSQVIQDLLITQQNGQLVVQEVPRNFRYTTRWSTNENFLTFDGVVFTSAPSGVKVWQNAGKYPEIFGLEKSGSRSFNSFAMSQPSGISAVLTRLEMPSFTGPLTDENGLEGNLKKLSWFLRNQTSLQNMRFEIHGIAK